MVRMPGNSTMMSANAIPRHVVLKLPRCAWIVSSSVPNTMSLIHSLCKDVSLSNPMRTAMSTGQSYTRSMRSATVGIALRLDELADLVASGPDVGGHLDLLHGLLACGVAQELDGGYVAAHRLLGDLEDRDL